MRRLRRLHTSVRPLLKYDIRTHIALKIVLMTIQPFRFQEFIEQAKEAQKLLNLPEAQNTKKQSFGVLDRFVPTVKTRK